MSERFEPVIGIVGLSLPTVSTYLSSLREDTIRKVLAYLNTNNIKFVLGKSVFNKSSYKFKSGSIEDRVKDLHDMFLNSEVNVIMNTFGGYNCNEILEFLDYELIRKNPKIVVGFSDITVLNFALHKKSGIKTIYGNNVGHFLYDEEIFQRILPIFSSEKTDFFSVKSIRDNQDYNLIRELPPLTLLPEKLNKAKGWAIGANLSTFCLMLGTEYLPDFTGSVLFLEYDKEETNALPSIERMLWQIRQNGIFDQIEALVFGYPESVVCTEETVDDNLQRILSDLTRGYKFPVLLNAPFGHLMPSWQIVTGLPIEINTNVLPIKLSVF